jgi:tight adherence protein C
MEPILITVTSFVLITTLVLAGYYALTSESPLIRRLETMTGQSAQAARRAPARGGLLNRILLALGPYAFGSGDASLTQTLSVAGLRGANALLTFLGARTLFSFGPALIFLVPQVSSGKPLAPTLLRAAIIFVVMHVVATSLLKRRARRRIDQITRGLPDSLDLMVICLEAGLSLNATIARVGEERSTLNDPLGDEFNQVSFEMRGSRSREEAMRALGARNGSDDLKALAALVIQSDRLGASMAKTLRAHADLLRTKRRQRAEEAARKLPIKMLFPLAVLILPALFVVVAGPAMIILKDFMKVMR